MHHERLMRYGATLTTVAALGGLASGCAEARTVSTASHAETVTHVEKNKKAIYIPEGVKASTGYEAQQHEIQEIITHLHKRLDGVLVLHQPAKNAFVSFASSPLSYVSENPDFLVSPKTTETKIISPKPAVGWYHGREYAVAIDAETGRWACLDVKFAYDMGALDMYAFKGKPLKLIDYPLEAQQADMPALFDPTHYGADWLMKGHTSDDVLQDIWLPTNIDPSAKKYSVVPHKVLLSPHG